MAIQVPKAQRRRFNIAEYERMGEVGIFDEDSNVELLAGVVWDMHPPAEHRFTVDEYNCLIEAGILTEDDQVELIEGEIVQMSPIGKRHQACVDRLTVLFVRYAGQAAMVRIQGPIQLGNSQPQPDVALLRPRDDYYAADLPDATDVLLTVEVSEVTLRSDHRVKLPLYAKAGVPEVWIVDLKGEIIEVYAEPAGGKYQVTRQFGRGETLTLADIPQFSVRVEDILG